MDEVKRFKHLHVIQYQVDHTFSSAYPHTEFSAALEREERRVLNQALALRPTLKEVICRFNHNWKLNSRGVWEMDRPQPRPSGTENGGHWAYYL